MVEKKITVENGGLQVEEKAQQLEMDRTNATLQKIIDNVEKVIVGKREVIQYSLVAMLCGGHVLLEDVPGVGKTMLIRAIAKSIGLDFKRIQFTPDLLPSDVSGVSIYNQKTMEFEFRPGPIMGNVILADEINRTSPKTQAALLEAMEEGSMTVDGVTHSLPKPFFVLATQNPIEYEGTFPLPEAQLDRFLLKLSMGYPEYIEEVDLLKRIQNQHPIEELHEVINANQLIEMQRKVKDVHLESSLRHYIIEITQGTRNHHAVYLGASPRGSIALMKTAQAAAFLHGRDYVVPDDIRNLVSHTLAHRIILKSESRLSGISVEQVLKDVLTKVKVPVFNK